jgi:hypothetical protein
VTGKRRWRRSAQLARADAPAAVPGRPDVLPERPCGGAGIQVGNSSSHTRSRLRRRPGLIRTSSRSRLALGRRHASVLRPATLTENGPSSETRTAGAGDWACACFWVTSSCPVPANPGRPRPDAGWGHRSGHDRGRGTARSTAWRVVHGLGALCAYGPGRVLVACHEHGTALRVFLPRAWDHPVASDGTTRRVRRGILVAGRYGFLQVDGLGGSGDGVPGGCRGRDS